jgi:hypothetical protein
MGRCPPGVFCLSDGLGTVLLTLFVILIVALIGAIFYRMTSPSSPIMISSAPAQQAASTTIINKGGDSRYDRAPQPLRDWMAPPEFPPRGGLTALPINIPTQGLPESFQSVGIINVGEQVLPLYGRRTAGGRDRWNYYTRTDTYNPVPVPVQFQRRDCMDDVGCSEIMSGEDVKIEALRKEGKTNIYRFDGPKYIPGMI